MAKKRSTFSPEFKMKIVLEALQDDGKLQQLADKYQISIKNIMNWKQQFFEKSHLAFENLAPKETLASLKKENERLERLLNQLQIEHDFVTQKVKEFSL